MQCDHVVAKLLHRGVTMRSLNSILDNYGPASAGRFPSILEKDSKLSDVIHSAINEFDRSNAQKDIETYLSESIAKYFDKSPGATLRVLQSNLPPMHDWDGKIN